MELAEPGTSVELPALPVATMVAFAEIAAALSVRVAELAEVTALEIVMAAGDVGG